MNQQRSLNLNFQQSFESYSTRDNYRYRQILLNKVKNYWITGVLEKSLHNKALIELGLEERLDALTSPLGVTRETPEDSRQVLPSKTKVIDIFERMGKGRSLLILGEPGSGKTITLLQLARHAIASAEQDITHAIPVILNLSSFIDPVEGKNEGRTISEWLVEELHIQYQIPKPIAYAWVKQQQLLLLLDGLDEVVEFNRPSCVEALNEFGRKYGSTEIIVCTRSREYEILPERLRLQEAIYLQPLTLPQVDRYLAECPQEMARLRNLIAEDPTLQELVTTPLMLSILTQVYRDITSEELSQEKNKFIFSTRQRRQHLFQTYVSRMFTRKKSRELYSQEQTIHWLSELAGRMSQESQTVFSIERIQPSWLQINFKDRFKFPWSRKPKTQAYWLYTKGVQLMSGSIWGLIITIAMLVAGNSTEVLFSGIVAGIVGAAITEVEPIKPVETLKWSWANAKKWIPLGLLFGLSGFVSAGFSWGLLLGFSGVFTTGLIEQETTVTTAPNQGIWGSAKNAIAFSLSGVVLCLLGAAALEGSLALPYIFSMSVFGLGIIGLILGLMKGGKACIQHLVLRFILYQKGIIPWNYARFLNYAAERNFLQRVGGGYIFVHRLLQEYFLSLGLEKYHQHTEIDSQDPQVYLKRANVLASVGDLQGAIASYDRVIDLSPDLAEAYAGRSLAHYMLGNYQGVLEDYRHTLQIDPVLAKSVTYTTKVTESSPSRIKGEIYQKNDVNYIVTLLNDNANTFEYVHHCLMKYIPGMTKECSWELTMQVHNEGQATIWSGNEQLAELYRTQLEQAGLSLDLCWPEVS